MADILLPEDYQNCIDEPSENQVTAICLAVGALNVSDDVSPENEDMTLKQDDNDTDHFTVDDLVVNPDDLLPPVVKLEKYASSDIVFNRQVVARNLLETLRVVIGCQDEVGRVISILCRLAEDFEPSVRAELMEQVPHIAAFCSEHSYQLGDVIQQYLVPLVIKYLTDINNQVRKTSQATLLVMAEQRLVTEVNLEERICPLILQLTESSHMDDHRTEAVTLMSKLSLLVGKDMTEQLFLQRFATLCLDSSFHVRKVCASSFGDFCGVVGKEPTEKQLLSKFYCLCEDGVWGVRKACAEVFMPVSCVCSMETRHKDLSPVFMNLLCDQSRWVRMAAFQALGPFISTFAEPDKTGLYYSKDGVLTIVDVPNNTTNKTQILSLEKDFVALNSSNCESKCNSSNISRTSVVSNNSCDNLVPQCDSDDKFSTCHNQDNMCHSGTYCTVIEVSSPSYANREREGLTLDATDTNKDHNSKYNTCDHDNMEALLTDKKVYTHELAVENATSPSHHQETVSAQDNRPNLNHSHSSVPSERKEDRLWHECLYGTSDDGTIISNGEVPHEIDIGRLSPTEDVTTNINLDSTRCKIDPYFSDSNLNTEVIPNQNKILQQSLQGRVTVNGINISAAPTIGELADFEDITIISNKHSTQCNQTSNCLSENSSQDISEIVNKEYQRIFETTHSRVILPHSKQNSILSDSETFSNHVADISLSHVGAIKSLSQSIKQDIPETSLETLANEGQLHVHTDNESAFNHFQYWRTPIPDVELDCKTEEVKATNVQVISRVCDKDYKGVFGAYFRQIDTPIQTTEDENADFHIEAVTRQVSDIHLDFVNSDLSTTTSESITQDITKEYVQTVCVNSAKNVQENLFQRGRISLSDNESSVTSLQQDIAGIKEIQASLCNSNLKTLTDDIQVDVEKEEEPPPTSHQLFSAHDQDIVPPELLLRYLSMTDAARAQSVDAEIARHCAYSLPAVALTLGRGYWPCLKETYETLASDMQGFIMQWKVRRTLASSMHQLAVILGTEITVQDLLPIFLGFIRDLDEVRIGILQHLSEFLEVLKMEDRRQFLPRLSEFLSTDNERNWRFRLILAEQLIPTSELFSPDDVRQFMVPLSLVLVKDKVCEVRLVAARVMAVLMRRMSQSPTSLLTKAVLAELAEQFIHAPKWLHRQIYVYLCQEFIKENSLPPDQFAEDAMPHLLYLCWDRVANVRLAIARCLAVVVWPLENFSDPDSPHRELLLQALHTLQSDMDADVRYYANMVATHECSCLQHGALNDPYADHLFGNMTTYWKFQKENNVSVDVSKSSEVCEAKDTPQECEFTSNVE